MVNERPKCPACLMVILELEGRVYSCGCGTFKDRPGFVAEIEKREDHDHPSDFQQEVKG